jgi:hypothetical protein
MNPVETNCLTDGQNHSDKVPMISIKFLLKGSKSGRKGEVPSLFNQKKSKYLQQFDSQGLPKSYQAGNGLSNFKSKYLCSIGQKAEKNIPDKQFQLQIKKGFFSQCCIFGIKRNFSIVKGLT